MKLSRHYGKVQCGSDNPMVLLKDVLEIVQERIDVYDKIRKERPNHTNHDAESCYGEACQIYAELSK